MSTEDQYRVLTTMPRDTSSEDLQQMFGISEHKARKAKDLQQAHGLLSTPDPKPGKRLSQDLLNSVSDFFESDKVSRQMPGKKDCVSMMVDGVKKKLQKKQTMFTVYERYLLFKELNSLVKIGFSKFAEARPKNVVLPGASGTHNVYVCTYHQNPKLIIANSGIASRKEFLIL